MTNHWNNEASVVHVGYIKTATTYLQSVVFNRPDLGLALPEGALNRARLVQEIILAPDFDFDAQGTSQRLRDIEQVVRQQGLLPVWSEETLLGNPASSRYDGYQNVLRLKSVFPDARIIITIREQRSMILSMYREFLKSGGTRPLIDFIGTGCEPISYSPILRPDFLKYHSAVQCYQRMFGEGNVLVLPQRLLQSNMESYFERLSNFVGFCVKPSRETGDANAGLSIPILKLNRVLNHVIKQNHRSSHKSWMWNFKQSLIYKTDRIVPRTLKDICERRCMDLISDRFQGYYTESNRILASITGLPLTALGYM